MHVGVEGAPQANPQVLSDDCRILYTPSGQQLLPSSIDNPSLILCLISACSLIPFRLLEHLVATGLLDLTARASSG